MLKNYIKIAFRNLLKNKAYTFVNLFGLGIAISVSILLFLTSYFEFTFDAVHTNKDRIFRVYFKQNKPEGVEFGNAVAVPMRGALLQDNKNEIQFASRILDGSCQLRFKEKNINNSINYIDADFFQMFSINFLQGNAQTAMSNLSNVVLNETIATNVFGKENPIGKTIKLNLDGVKKSFVVTAITQKSPENTGIENEIFVRFENHIDYQSFSDRWNASNHGLYIMLKEGINWQNFELTLKNFSKKYFKDAEEQLLKDGAKPDERGEVFSTRLMPLEEEHFDKKIGGGQAVSIVYPYTLLIISLLILLIACINFVNLSIARSLTRAKEVGMRKALGAFKTQIVGQFWGEAVLICLAALALGLALTYFLLPEYNALLRSKIEFSNLLQPVIFSIMLFCFAFITILAGGYPAWFVAKINTIEVLKGRFKVSRSSGSVRNVLIIIQFAFSILLICCTLVIWNQLWYLQEKPLGFEQDNVVSIPVGSEANGNKMLDLMRNKLATNPSILSVSAADNNLGRGKDNSGFKSVFGFVQDGKSYSTNGLYVDFDYIKTLGLKLKEGRDFSRQFASDSTDACIINETMAKQLGGKNLIGKRMMLDDNGGKIIVGIVKDYHFESLKNKVDAITLMVKGFEYKYIFVKIAPAKTESSLALLEKTYRQFAPNSEYLGTFLDENRANQYKKEKRFSQIFISAAILAILLSCMGLLAMSMMMISQRTKEIGLRKVLGASIVSITALLSKDFLKLVLVAVLIASPFAYYFMNQWLADFAYRIDLQWWHFVLSGIVCGLIAFLTVSYQATKAALMNPVKSLRSE
jgi:putative ABC transport system permease protein